MATRLRLRQRHLACASAGISPKGLGYLAAPFSKAMLAMADVTRSSSFYGTPTIARKPKAQPDLTSKKVDVQLSRLLRHALP